MASGLKDDLWSMRWDQDNEAGQRDEVRPKVCIFGAERKGSENRRRGGGTMEARWRNGG